MSEKEKKEHADKLKDGIKEFLDCIDTDNDFGQHIIKLLYGVVRSGFWNMVLERRKAVSRHEGKEMVHQRSYLYYAAD